MNIVQSAPFPLIIPLRPFSRSKPKKKPVTKKNSCVQTKSHTHTHMPKVSSTASKCILNEREIQSLHSKLPRYSKLSVEEFTNRYMQPTSSNALSGLRVDDLKEILRFIKAEKSMLHVAMSGNKADLVDRIIHLLFGEQHSKSSSQTGHSSMNALQVER